MKLLTVKIENELYDRFAELCRRDGLSMSLRVRAFVQEVADGLVVVGSVGDAGPPPAHPLALVRDAPVAELDGGETVAVSREGAGSEPAVTKPSRAIRPLPRGSREPVKAAPQHDGAISRLAAAKRRGALREAMDVPAVPGESCGHAELNKLPYGTWCKDCGRRMR